MSSSRVCAIVVTFNRKDSLRVCLDSLAAQTSPPDCVLVVDNAGADGTAEMLEARYPAVTRLRLPEHAGGAGGLTAGLRWSHCRKFDWMWALNDQMELEPRCLETMLSFGSDADLIRLRQKCRTDGAIPAHAVRREQTEAGDLQGALIGRKVIETVGLPDPRYYNVEDDTAYGTIASRGSKSICLDYPGILTHAPGTGMKDRADFYLGIRNLFLNRDHLAKNGLSPAPRDFFLATLRTLLKQLGQAAGGSDRRVENTLAAIDGLKDGIYKRFDRVPRS